jgi:hypothetical protein
VTDPATKIKVNVGLTIKSGLASETVSLAMECDPIRTGHAWKVSLQDADRKTEVTQVPIMQRLETIDTTLPYGFYVIELLSDEQSLVRFPFTIEPFSLPEALDAAEEYLAQTQYERAIAVLEDAGARHPESAEVWDLLSVVEEELAALDLGAVEDEEQEDQEEQEEQVVFRGTRERFRGVGTVLQKMRSKFGDSVASLLVARKVEPASVSDARLASVTELPVSLSVLRALRLMEERLIAAGEETKLRDERLFEALAAVTGRLGQLETYTLDLGDHIDAIRGATGDVEEKFRLAGEHITRFLDSTRSAGVSLPDFAPFFQEKLGEVGWRWLGLEVQEMFISAEDIYRYFSASATAETRDFTPALLEFCRGFELLLNARLGALCVAIRNLISGSEPLKEFVDRELGWAKSEDMSKFSKSYTVSQFAVTLRLGNAVAERYPALIGKDVPALLTSSGLSDHESICILSHIGQTFRNGKIHPYPGSGRMFTSPAEVQILRKLLFSLDEERLDGTKFFSELHELRTFSHAERTAAIDSLGQTWTHYSGLIPKLRRISEQAAAA